MTFKDLAKRIATCYNSLPALIDALRDGFANVEGGGNTYGTFIDTDNVITTGTYNTSLSYTATENCFISLDWATAKDSSTKLYINGEDVFESYQSASVGAGRITLPLKKDQTITGTTSYSSTKNYTVYGIQTG